MQSKAIASHRTKLLATFNIGAQDTAKVCDKRKRPIRGLWERNGRYYAQITVEEPVTGSKRVRRISVQPLNSSVNVMELT